MVFKRDGYKCHKCGNEKNIQCHHLTYENLFHEEKHLDDLITLCKKCHKKIHNK
jgi:5-methylcytosine-specific restriction endonuclease McrA